MIKFIKRSFLFFIFLVLIFIGITCTVFNSRKNIIKLPNDINTVFIGHSTLEVGLNDSLYPRSFNFAHSGEALRLMYAKLKLIHKYNPQIDTVFVVFDDINIWNTKLETAHNNLNHVDQFTIEDRITDFNNNMFLESFSHLFDLKKIGPNFLSYLKPQDIRNLRLGRFVYLDRYKLHANIEIFKNSKNTEDNETDIPDLNLYYFNQVISYCQKNHLTLFFLSPPKYPLIWYKNKFRKIHSEYFNEIPLVDCMEWVYPDSCYGDMVHLNHKGAELFTKDLNNLIRNKTNRVDALR